MSETQDLVSPAFVGDDRIGILIEEDSFIAGNLVVERPINLRFNYALTQPEGVTLPILLIIQPEFGDGDGYSRTVFTRFAPNGFTFKVVGAGAYLILIKERYHNEWQGRMEIEVQGDPFSDVQISQRTP